MTRSVSTALPPAHVPSGNRPDVRLPCCGAPLVRTVPRAGRPKPLRVTFARRGCATDGVQGARRCRSKHLSDMDMRIPQSAAPARFLRTAVRQPNACGRQAMPAAATPDVLRTGGRMASCPTGKRLPYRPRHHFAMDACIPQSVPARSLCTAVCQNTLSTQQAANCDSPAKRPRAARTGGRLVRSTVGKRLSI